MNRKTVFFFLLILIFMVFVSNSIIAQQDVVSGRMDGKRDAKADVNGRSWFLRGCIINFFVPIFGGLAVMSYVYEYEPIIPNYRFVGKSEEYINAYTISYKETVRKIQVNKVSQGCITSIILYALSAGFTFLACSNL